MGDLLRSELADASGSSAVNGLPSPQSADIERQASSVPPTLANKVLLRAIEKLAAWGEKTFLVEGFPCTIEQAESFAKVCNSGVFLYPFQPTPTSRDGFSFLLVD